MKAWASNLLRRSHIAIAVRVLFACACIVVVLELADATEIGKTIATLSLSALLMAFGLHAAIIVVLSWRWALIVRGLDSEVPFMLAVRATFTSTVLNLTLPTSVGGDVGRVWFGKLQGIPVISGSVAAILDRGIGLAILVFLVAASSLWFGGLTGMVTFFAVLIAGSAGLLLLLRWAARLPAESAAFRTAEAVRAVVRNVVLLAHSSLLSLAAHLAAALIAMVIANGMGIPLTIGNAVLLFPAVLLATAMPVSIGGWGLRELAAIPLLALAGIAADGAAAIALMFGVTQLVAALAGTLAANLPLVWRTAT
jgi:uncharacterized membrane protein YbhN (UPF0104 family)